MPKNDCRDKIEEIRCACGSLLVRLVSGGVELKCRRCKRLVVLPFEDEDEAGEGDTP